MSYRPIKRLGAGFFGEVWLEHDEGLDRLCAAKYLNPAKLPSVVDAFAEARAMMVAEHENVAIVYSADDVNGVPVIRMEYLPDGSVEDQHSGAPLSVRDAVRIMEETCRGLEHLHLSGLLHRDIKPANLLMSPGSGVKVSDFGLSCKSSEVSQATPLAYTLHLPPESIPNGEGITTRVGDVYAAGVTAYRLLNGDALLISAHSSDLLDKIAKGKYPDRQAWRPHVHPKLRRAVLKAMHVDPSKRHSSAADFRRSLEQARPIVSWCLVPHGHHEWEGEAVNGTNWSAAIRPLRGGFRFNLTRRLPGKTWRRVNADERDDASEDVLVLHAADVLGRVASEGR